MEQMIERKNKLLKEAGAALKEVWELAIMASETECSTSMSHKTLTKLVNSRLRSLSCNYDEYINESELALPEAEEGSEEEVLEETKDLDDQLEEDLPFVTPSDKKEEVEA